MILEMVVDNLRKRNHYSCTMPFRACLEISCAFYEVIIGFPDICVHVNWAWCCPVRRVDE